MLLSIHEAVMRGVDRLRLPKWSNPADHIKIDLLDGRMGPWVHLYSPMNKQINGSDPQNLIAYQFDLDEQEWEPYNGPSPDSAEYREQQDYFAAIKL